MPHPEPVVLRGRVVAPERVWDDGVVAAEGARLSWVGPADAWRGRLPEPTGDTLLPGLVDVHCHGAAGSSANGRSPQDVAGLAEHHLAHGTTTLLASLVTAPAAEMVAAVAACAALAAEGQLAGVHLEGPFLSAARCGAQDPEALLLPDPAVLARLLEAGRGHVRTLTLAPELPGADRLLAAADEAGVLVSVGHTDGCYTEVDAVLRRVPGRSSVTHLFNGMPPLHHRSPGPAAAALAAAARGETVVELVADGVHLADQTVQAVFDLVGPDAIALVTDAMAAAGMPDGRYALGRQDVDVVDGVARLAGTDVLAGGTSRLLDVVRRCARLVGLREAVAAASRTPARLLGLDEEVGALAAGLRADVVVTDEALQVRRVLRAGQWCAPAAARR